MVTLAACKGIQWASIHAIGHQGSQYGQSCIVQTTVRNAHGLPMKFLVKAA